MSRVGFRIRPMTLDDLPAVRPLEAAAFPSGWPATAFDHELRHNGAARYLLLELASGADGWVAGGFAGLWLQFDAAHIVTVAVDPPLRRQGYGRLLVHALVSLAAANGMENATLEVRRSNEAARALYRLYGFHEVGERKRYYADNGEDAVIMTTEAIASSVYLSRLARLEADLIARFGAACVAACMRDVPGATPAAI